MTHEDAGHYAKKHKGQQLDQKAAFILKQKSKQGKITCASVHAVAKELGITPAEAGIQTDLLELKLTKCSLGLFGYEPNWNILQKDLPVSEELNTAINNVSKNGRITCAACWKIADDLKMKKIQISSACEKKGLKIKECQIGAF